MSKKKTQAATWAGKFPPKYRWLAGVLAIAVIVAAAVWRRSSERRPTGETAAQLAPQEPDSAKAELAVAQQFLKDGKPDDALPHLVHLASTFPTDQHLVLLGTTYLGLNRGEEGIATLKKAAELNPNSDGIGFLGTALVETGHPSDGVPYLESLVRRHPESSIAIAVLSLAYAEIGRPAEARAAAQAAISTSVNDGAVFLYVGRSMLALRDFDNAIKSLTNAVGLRPDSDEAKRFLQIAKDAKAGRVGKPAK